MEDVDLVRRIGRRRLVILPIAARTSAARWRAEGWTTRSLRNVTCSIALLSRRAAASAASAVWLSMALARHLVIFTRYPRFGTGKSRLAAGAGPGNGFAIPARDACRRCCCGSAGIRRWTTWLAVTPDRSGPWPRHIGIRPQGKGDLGQRMTRVVERLAPGPVVIVGTDSPRLRADHVVARVCCPRQLRRGLRAGKRRRILDDRSAPSPALHQSVSGCPLVERTRARRHARKPRRPCRCHSGSPGRCR